MTYELILSDEAKAHMEVWRKSGQKKNLKKITDLFEELRLHPKTGTGHVEQLKGNYSGYWSREICNRLRRFNQGTLRRQIKFDQNPKWVRSPG